MIDDVYIVISFKQFSCYIQSCNIFYFWYILLPTIFKIGLAQGFYSYDIKPYLKNNHFGLK